VKAQYCPCCDMGHDGAVCPRCGRTEAQGWAWVRALENNQGALGEQIGGDHYKKMVIQPAEFATKNNLGFLAGCVVKRVCRYRDKNGREDLEKAIHELQLLIELEYGND
jgi:hypothetical protein